jgi:hypothetical protein
LGVRRWVDVVEDDALQTLITTLTEHPMIPVRQHALAPKP